MELFGDISIDYMRKYTVDIINNNKNRKSEEELETPCQMPRKITKFF